MTRLDRLIDRMVLKLRREVTNTNEGWDSDVTIIRPGEFVFRTHTNRLHRRNSKYSSPIRELDHPKLFRAILDASDTVLSDNVGRILDAFGEVDSREICARLVEDGKVSVLQLFSAACKQGAFYRDATDDDYLKFLKEHGLRDA